MKIHDVHYLSGMPVNDSYNIELKQGIVLQISHDEFKELVNCISEKQSSDFDRMQKASDKYSKRVEKVESFIKDIRSVFYHGDEEGDFLFRTEIKDISYDRLNELLENHKVILGLE